MPQLGNIQAIQRRARRESPCHSMPNCQCPRRRGLRISLDYDAPCYGGHVRQRWRADRSGAGLDVAHGRITWQYRVL